MGGGGVFGGPARAAPPVYEGETPGTVFAVGPFLTVTASAWRYFADPPAAVARDVPGEPMTRVFSGDGFAADFRASGGRTEAVIRLTRTPEFETRTRAFTLFFAPRLGAGVSLRMTARDAAPPVSDAEAERALPAAARVVLRRVAAGYSGVILTVTAHDPAFAAAIPPEALPPGFGAAIVGGKAALTISPAASESARDLGFPVSISVVGRNSRRAVSVFVLIRPVALELDAFERPVNNLRASGAALIALGERPEFSGGSFEKVSGANQLRVDAQSGAISAVSGQSQWTAGQSYFIVVGARNPAFFVGRVLITAELRAAASGLPLFSFNGIGIRGAGESAAADGIEDANGANPSGFEMTYRGRRRGLHWMESGAAAAGLHQRTLCDAGGRGTGASWRPPLAAEIAGALLEGASADIAAANPAGGGAAAGVSLPLAAVDADHRALSGLSDGPFFADFLLAGSPARVDAPGGDLRISGGSGGGAARRSGWSSRPMLSSPI